MASHDAISPSPASAAAAASQRVLLVRPSALGDVARTVPALVTLRQAMPEAHIDWLVVDSYQPLLRHHPAVDGLVPFNRKQLGRMWRSPSAAAAGWRFAQTLRRAKYDLVVDLQGLLRSGIFTRITGAPRRIGFANAREGAAMAYTEKYALSTQMHTVDRMLGLLEAAGMTPSRDMTLHPGQAELAQVRTMLAQWFGDEHAGFTCIAPTAQWVCKCWPAGEYAKLARALLERDDAGRRVVVICAPHERQRIGPLLDAMQGCEYQGRPAMVCPPLDVGQMLALLSLARLVVCNDSGPLHMAVGLHRPIVSIFGPTDPAIVGPYGRLDTVVSPGPVDLPTQQYFRRHRHDQSLISKVTMKQVMHKVDEQLSRRV